MSDLQSVIEKLGVHPALGAEASGWWIEQSAYELAAFVDAITPLGIKTVLEIGTGHKMGLARFMSEIMGWKVVSVDIHQPVYRAPLVDLRVSETRLDFPNTTFDLLIIDADHRYESVKADYEHYGKYVSKVVMFHDIAGLRDCEGAARFWFDIARQGDKDIKTGYHVILDPNEGSCCGIGWIDVQATNLLKMTVKVDDSGVATFPQAGIKAVVYDSETNEATAYTTPPPSPSPKKKPGRKPKAKAE